MGKEVKYPVPNTEEGMFLQNKNCNERIYIYLLLRSKCNTANDETHRYVERMSNEQIAKDLGLNRNTVGKRLKDLITFGYVIKQGKYYKVPKTDYFRLIPQQTLDFLLNYIENKDRIIKLYIVLYDYYITHKTFSMQDLHEALGYSLTKAKKPDSNNTKHIQTCLMLLSESGLVDYQIKQGRNAKGAPIALYNILLMRSDICDKYKEAYKIMKAEHIENINYDAITNFYKENSIEVK